jgi:hypothetical protein
LVVTCFSLDNHGNNVYFLVEFETPVPCPSRTIGTVSFQTPRLEKPMDPRFDIFQVEENSTPRKGAFAQTLNAARKRAQETPGVLSGQVPRPEQAERDRGFDQRAN